MNGVKHYSTLYTEIFYSHLLLRESCYNCHFCNYQRPGDISIADYWGWERISKTFNQDNKGCSLIICNTKKGKQWFSDISDNVDYIPVDDLKKTTQAHLQHATPKPVKRDKFCNIYTGDGYVKFVNKFKKDQYWSSLFHRIKCIPARIINKLLHLS